MRRRPLRVRLAAASLLVPLALVGCTTEDDPVRSENGSEVDGDVRGGDGGGDAGSDADSEEDPGSQDGDSEPDPDEG